jgi:hypothetical protein
VAEITRTLTSQVTTRLADLELTLAEMQATATRQSSNGSLETRAMTTTTERLMTPVLERLVSLETSLEASFAPITARLEAVASLGEGLKAVGSTVEEVAERVKRIEAQPSSAAILGPTAGIAERRLPLDPSGATRAVSGASVDEQIALLTSVARRSNNPAVQSEIGAAVLRLQEPAKFR